MRKSKYVANAPSQRAAGGGIAAGSRRWNGLPRAIRTGIMPQYVRQCDELWKSVSA